jgi:hypothetical protein
VKQISISTTILKRVKVRQFQRFTFGHPPPRLHPVPRLHPAPSPFFFRAAITRPPLLLSSPYNFASYPTPFPMPPPPLDLRPSSPIPLPSLLASRRRLPFSQTLPHPTNPQRGAIAHRASPRHRHLRNRRGCRLHLPSIATSECLLLALGTPPPVPSSPTLHVPSIFSICSSTIRRNHTHAVRIRRHASHTPAPSAEATPAGSRIHCASPRHPPSEFGETLIVGGPIRCLIEEDPPLLLSSPQPRRSCPSISVDAGTLPIVDNWTPAMPNPPLSSLLHDEIHRLLRQVASHLLQSLGIRRWKALLGVGGTADAGAEVAARQEKTFAAEQSLLKKVSLTTEGFHRWLCSDANAALARKGVILLQLRDYSLLFCSCTFFSTEIFTALRSLYLSTSLDHTSCSTKFPTRANMLSCCSILNTVLINRHHSLAELNITICKISSATAHAVMYA